MYADLLRSTLTSTIIVSESLWVEAYLNISLLPVSNRLRGSEGDSLHKYTCIQICPDANDAPGSDTLSRDWKLISLQLNQTLVNSDQSEQYILLDTLLAGIISYIIDFH